MPTHILQGKMAATTEESCKFNVSDIYNKSCLSLNTFTKTRQGALMVTDPRFANATSLLNAPKGQPPTLYCHKGDVGSAILDTKGKIVFAIFSV